MMSSQKWGYIRIITGTILGGALGFYVMHRLEINHKERVKERLQLYEKEKLKRQEGLLRRQLSDFDESS